jgi:hypothetical protein
MPPSIQTVKINISVATKRNWIAFVPKNGIMRRKYVAAMVTRETASNMCHSQAGIKPSIHMICHMMLGQQLG